MAVGDIVKIGFGSAIHGIAPDNVPVYDLEKDAGGNIRFDLNDCAFPRPVGGVKGGTDGKITGMPIKVQRAYVERMSGNVKPLGGVDYILLFPVHFLQYQRDAYVQQDHVHLFQGRQQ